MYKKMFYLLVFSSLLIHSNAADNRLFPEIPGWKMKISDRVYNSGDLWELINGAADIFLSYYFEDLHIAEYSKKDQLIRVELYRHKSYDDTYGIYTAERMPDYPQVSLGSQGYKSQGVLNFFAGNYYVKIMSAGVEETNEETIALVADKVESQLAQPDKMPDLLSKFPEEGKVALSDSYIAQNFMGYSFLHNAFTVKYEKPAAFQMFIIELNPSEIQNMLNRYTQIVKPENVLQKDGIYKINDPYNGPVFIMLKQGYMIGILNMDNEEIAREYIRRSEAKLNQ